MDHFTEPSHYTPVVTVRCSVCGGESAVIAHDPRGDRHCCAHHGVGDAQDGRFEQHGVGEIGSQFRVIHFAVLNRHPGDVPRHKAIIASDEPDSVDRTRFEDYAQVNIFDESIGEQAAQRGVSESAVRTNIARAAAVFDGE